MTFGDEKRRLLGWLALLAPLPLPLNDVLEWPVLFVYLGLVTWFLQRLETGRARPWPNWLLNVLGLVYLPVLAVDMRVAVLRDQVVRSLLHLILFLVVVKLFSIRREKEKWHVLVALFFLFVAAMATSSHLTIAFYLVAALAAGLYALARFAHLHVLAAVSPETERPGRVAAFPRMRWTPWLATAAIVLVAVPIFASMPRLRQPWVMGRGSGNLGLARTTGFSDTVDLSLTSEIRANRNVALRMQPSQPVADPGSLRFKGATYDYYRQRRWHRDPRAMEELAPGEDRRFVLAAGAVPVSTAVLYLEPFDTTSLIVPTGTAAVELTDGPRRLVVDPGGALYLPGLPRRQTLRYEVWQVPGTLIAAPDPDLDAPVDEEPLDDGPLDAPVDDAPADDDPLPEVPPTLDPGGATPRIAGLAARVMGDGPDGERVDRLERHLLSEYDYTLDFVGRDTSDPLESFLFEYRSGHCEYFATAMVVMLRSQGVPARFVTGFLGAEPNRIEDYYVVRQQNAHAWVEAWTPERGWRVYDPTPPEGRPSLAEQDLRLLMQQFYDYVAFRWDRYVLTYGAEDQAGFFASVRQRLAAAWNAWWASDDAPPRPAAAEVPAIEGAVDTSFDPRESFWQSPRVRLGGLLLLLVCAAGVAWAIARRPLGPAAAYARLRRKLPAAGLEVEPSLAPLDLARRVAAHQPRVATEVDGVVARYLRASYGPARGGGDEPNLRPAVEAVLRGVREESRERARRRRRQQRRRSRAARATAS